MKYTAYLAFSLIQIQKYTGYLAFSGTRWNLADFMVYD